MRFAARAIAAGGSRSSTWPARSPSASRRWPATSCPRRATTSTWPPRTSARSWARCASSPVPCFCWWTARAPALPLDSPRWRPHDPHPAHSARRVRVRHAGRRVDEDRLWADLAQRAEEARRHLVEQEADVAAWVDREPVRAPEGGQGGLESGLELVWEVPVVVDA